MQHQRAESGLIKDERDPLFSPNGHQVNPLGDTQIAAHLFSSNRDAFCGGIGSSF